MAYEDVVEGLHGRERKKYGNNTYLELGDDGNSVKLVYHNTIVAVFKPDMVILNSSGWHTSTTKERLNWAMHLAGINDSYISQVGGIWYLTKRDGKKAAFYEGMKIDYSGDVIGESEAGLAEIDNRKSTLKLIQEYVRGLGKAIDEGGKLSTNEYSENLLRVVEAKYYSYSLLYNALGWVGHRYPSIFLEDANDINDDVIRQHKEIILHAVRKYLKDSLLDRPE